MRSCGNSFIERAPQRSKPSRDTFLLQRADRQADTGYYIPPVVRRRPPDTLSVLSGFVRRLYPANPIKPPSRRTKPFRLVDSRLTDSTFACISEARSSGLRSPCRRACFMRTWIGSLSASSGTSATSRRRNSVVESVKVSCKLTAGRIGPRFALRLKRPRRNLPSPDCSTA